MRESLKITFLGSGPSTGVPLLGCQCKVCTSSNPQNTRLRASIMVQFRQEKDFSPTEVEPYVITEREIADYPVSHHQNIPKELLSKANEEHIGPDRTILIDASPDFRTQALAQNISRLDGVFFTHEHADHIYGIDDLRLVNFRMRKQIRLYATEKVIAILKARFEYAISPDSQYEGGAPPELITFPIEPLKSLSLFGKEFLPIPLYHGSLPILGFEVDRFAYCTDCSRIPEETKPYLRNLDVLVMEAIRSRPHNTHFCVSDAIKAIEELKPKRAILTHCGHELDYEQTNHLLKHSTDIPTEMAYDGMVVTL